MPEKMGLGSKKLIRSQIKKDGGKQSKMNPCRNFPCRLRNSRNLRCTLITITVKCSLHYSNNKRIKNRMGRRIPQSPGVKVRPRLSLPKLTKKFNKMKHPINKQYLLSRKTRFSFSKISSKRGKKAELVEAN